MKKRVVVASRNPVKLNAVKIAFGKMFKEKKFDFEGIAVSSGVQDQPIGDATTLIGAYNRANNAMAEMRHAEYWVGIEGGIEQTAEEEMMAFAWIVVRSRELIGKGKTGTFFLPNTIKKVIDEGKELGEADDIVFGQSNSKQKNGAVGILTGDVISRTDLYAQGVILALIPFVNTLYYNHNSPPAQ